jgi:hypothetical protein
MDYFLWNLLLTLLIAVVGYLLREKTTELQRIQILLNKTREEMAKECATRQELYRLEDKMRMENHAAKKG